MVYKQHPLPGVFVFWSNFPIFAALNGGVAQVVRALDSYPPRRTGVQPKDPEKEFEIR